MQCRFIGLRSALYRGPMGEGGYIAFFRHTLSVVKTTEQIEQFLAQVGGRAVSYTHLTLPTILRV